VRSRFLKIFCFIFLFQIVATTQARAVSFGDAALTVSIATVSGAIIGVSTLPFYEDSGAHSKNIFYGAAIGAVVGVLISAYAGVEQGKNAEDAEEDAFLKKRLEQNQIFAFQRSLKPESKFQSRNSVPSVASAAWTPIQISF
jgi:hypothetical protein